MAVTDQFLAAGKANRFTSENQPENAARYGSKNAPMHSSDERNPNKPWSIQREMRMMAARIIAGETDEEILQSINELRKGKKSMAYFAALKALHKSMLGDAAMLEKVLERVDGKVEQPFSMKDADALLKLPVEQQKELLAAYVQENILPETEEKSE